MEPIATTNVQLYNQLRGQGRSVEDLALVARAYDLVRTLYSGYYQANGVPFVTHDVGVASVVAVIGHPAPFVAAGLLHNVYGNGDFGDARMHAVTPARRRLVTEAVGTEVEDLVHRFNDFRIVEVDPVERSARLERLDHLEPDERRLVAMDLADLLEKFSDGGVNYFGDNDWLVGAVAGRWEELVDAARRLGEPELAAALHETSERAASTTPPPDVLRPLGQRYLELRVPLSCRRRRAPIARARAAQVLGRAPRILAVARAIRRVSPRARLPRGRPSGQRGVAPGAAGPQAS